MDEISIDKARPKLGDLVHDAQNGAVTIITRNGKPAAMVAPLDILTDYDRQVIENARHVADLPIRRVREWTGEDGGHEAFVAAFVRAQARIDELLALVERLAPEAAEDSHG